MRTVILENIKIENFKGIRSLDVDLSTKGAVITGANEQGKSTIYDAYLWCLFGVTTRQNDCVQPIGADNQIVHKIETKVELHLVIDYSQSVKITRILTEKWKAQDTAEEKFISAEQKRFYNDVPCSVKELETKLNAIFPIDKWLMLSNIRTFMEQRIESRRELLNQIASGLDERELVKPYPLVAEAFNEGKTIVEFEKQVKDTKKRAEARIKDIPKQVAAQDKLRIEEDFNALREEKEALDIQIADIDKQLQASPEELEAERRRKEELVKSENEYTSLRKAWNDEHFKRMQEVEINRLNAKELLSAAKREKERHKISYAQKKKELETAIDNFNTAKKEWLAKNEETISPQVLEVCPCCGHKLTDSERQRMRDTAVVEFNEKKAARLTELYNDCTEIKEKVNVLQGAISDYESNIQQADIKAIAIAQKDYEAAVSEKDAESNRKIEEDTTVENARKAVEMLSTAAKQLSRIDTNEEIKSRRDSLQSQRDAIIRRLASEQVNANVDKEKERLNNEARVQAQVVADCDKALSQIRRYKKDIVDHTEESVNKYFRIVNWKFVEQNKTNDDEKQLCTPLYNGIEYSRQNFAAQVNMGIDICEGIKRGFDVQLPLFVDNTESVCDILKTDSQVILLRVMPDKKLTINSL